MKGREPPVSQGARETDRGQLVLIAAIALVVALVPLVLAYAQLGYHEDLESAGQPNQPEQIDRTLDHALQDVVGNATFEFEWEERQEATGTVRERLAPKITAIEESGLDAGTAIHVSYNDSKTDSWVAGNCPSGENRQFGDCDGVNGIAVQERNGDTHVLGVGFDIVIISPEAETSLTTIIGVT